LPDEARKALKALSEELASATVATPAWQCAGVDGLSSPRFYGAL